MTNKQYKIRKIKLNEPDFLWVCNLAYETGMSIEKAMEGLVRPIEISIKSGRYFEVEGKYQRQTIYIEEYIKDGSFIKILYHPHYFNLEKLEIKNLPQLESFELSEWIDGEFTDYWDKLNPNGYEVSFIDLMIYCTSGGLSNLPEHFTELTGDDTIYDYDNPRKLSDEYKEWLKTLKKFEKDSGVFNYVSETLSEISIYAEPSFNSIINPLEKVLLVSLPKLNCVNLEFCRWNYEIIDGFALDLTKLGVTGELEISPKRLLEITR